MPISNPLHSPQNLLIEPSDPIATPDRDRIFWLNALTKKLWIAIATNSPADWVAIGADMPVIDAATILNKILVQDGQVLTTEDHVIFED